MFIISRIHSTLVSVAVLLAGAFVLFTSPALAQTASVTVDAPVCGAFPSEGNQYLCSCPSGFPLGSVWGSGPYTGDSNICTAALQSGAISRDGGVVLVLAAPGQDSYKGITQNGVTSSGWNAYGRSFSILPVGQPVVNGPEVCSTLPAGVDTYECTCSAHPDLGASVWGSSPYTADSDICAAAVHSGVIDENGGVVKVHRVLGLEHYAGSKSFGVSSRDWSSYDTSFIFDWNR